MSLIKFFKSIINTPKELNKIMARLDELRSLLQEQNEVITEEAQELRSAFEALMTRINELEVNQVEDSEIQELEETIQGSINRIEALSDSSVPEEEEEPTEETPVEEPTTEE